jgi:hypothetical protein
MAAPLEAYVQLPDDSTNVGKKIRTQSRVIAGQTVHGHFFIPGSVQLILGAYFSNSAVYSVASGAQNGTTAAVWWLQVPSTATCNARVRKIDVCMTNTSGTADMTSAPRFAFARFTFTGTFSGSTQVVAKRATADASNQADVRTAATGATVTLGNTAWSATVPGMDFTTAGIVNSFLFQVWHMGGCNLLTEDEFIDLAPGEGLVAFQLDAGTTSDQRRLAVNLCWDEYDNQ